MNKWKATCLACGYKGSPRSVSPAWKCRNRNAVIDIEVATKNWQKKFPRQQGKILTIWILAIGGFVLSLLVGLLWQAEKHEMSMISAEESGTMAISEEVIKNDITSDTPQLTEVSVRGELERRDPTSIPELTDLKQRPRKKDDDVLEVQRLLTQLGYDPGVLDGILGMRTAQAIRAFQQDFHLEEDGQISRMLLSKLSTASTDNMKAPSEQSGVFKCQVESSHGFTQKIITYTNGRTTYAINGHARQRAASHGWKDGKEKFTPSEMQQKLNEGLEFCGEGRKTRLTSVPANQVNPSEANRQQPMTAEELTKAVETGDTQTVKRYLAAGFDVNKRTLGIPTLNIEGSTAVDSAAASGQCEILKLLVNAGGDPDPKNQKHGFTPLSLASLNGATACVEFLLSRSVRLDVRTEPGGDTALILAAYQGHIGVVRLLVNAGANLTISNKDGDTPFRAAKVFGQHAVADFIKSKGGR